MVNIEEVQLEILDTGHITNCYILYNNEKEALIVDPAFNSEVIINKIEKLNLKPKYVLLTHAHADHTMALNEIVEKYNINVIANKKEKNMIEGKVNDYADVFGLKTIEKPLDKFIYLKDGEIIKLGNDEIKMIHTPGHTVGSVCYYIVNQNMLLTGDTLFKDCFGRCDLATGSIDDMIKSLIKLYKEYNNCRIYPGHESVGVTVEDTYYYIKIYLRKSFQFDLDSYVKDDGGKYESL